MPPHEALTLDSPHPDTPMEFKLKVASVFAGLSLMLILAGLAGAWVNDVWFQAPAKPYAPISYAEPARVVDAFGNIPEVEEQEIPPPSIQAPEGAIPIQLTRTVNCENYQCPSGGMKINIDVTWSRLNIQRTIIETIPVIQDAPLVLEEGVDYIRNAVVTNTVRLEPYNIPEDVLAAINGLKSAYSAWRIDGTTVPDHEDAQGAVWVSDVFHIYNPSKEG